MKLLAYRIFLFVSCICFANYSLAQSSLKHPITFQLQFADRNIELSEQYYAISEQDSVQFETLKFYVSKLELLNSGRPVWVEENSFHLIDASSSNSMSFILDLPKDLIFTELRFNVGIDSTTNVSGALGGDLDPTKGMYWTWQNGYINFKLEGKSNRCKTKGNEFQFHLGGYLAPYSGLQTLVLPMVRNKPTEIVFDLQKLIVGLDLSKQNQIMSPSTEAVLISSLVSKSFFTR